MIYVDSSVVLAHLLLEDSRPPRTLWDEDLMSSELLNYEVWVRLNARAIDVQADADSLLGHIELVGMTPRILERAKKPFPVQVRTLDALHLSTASYVRASRNDVMIATYDRRLSKAAAALGFPLYDLSGP